MKTAKNFRLWRWIFLTLLVGELGVGNLPAELSIVPRRDFWTPSTYPLYALLVTNGTVYVGGNFTELGSGALGSVTVLDTVSGEPDFDLTSPDGTVVAVTPDGRGGWFLSGDFRLAGGLPRTNLVHILNTGRVDPEWKADADGEVLCLALAENTLYVGGAFGQIGGQPRECLAALEAATGKVTPWQPAKLQIGNGARGGVWTLLPYQSNLYVGGIFDRAGEVFRKGAVAFNRETAQLAPWNPNASNPNADQTVFALVLHQDRILAGGDFTRIGGLARNCLASLDATTGSANEWNPGADHAVAGIVADCDIIYVAGGFEKVGGKQRKYLAAVDAHSGLATDWAPDPDGFVRRLVLSGNVIYAGGGFHIVNGQARSRVAALDLTTGEPTAWQARGPCPIVNDLALFGHSLFLGGAYTAGAAQRSYVAALDAATGKPRAWNPEVNGPVDAVALVDNTVYLGGAFTSVGGQSRTNLAAVDAVTGQVTPWKPDPNQAVRKLLAWNNTLYVSGSFTRIAGQVRTRLAAFDTQSGQLTSWNPNADGLVVDMVVASNLLYVAGLFSSIGSQARLGSAALNLTTGQATAFNASLDGPAYALTLSGPTLYVGGEFTQVLHAPRRNLAALDTGTGRLLSWNLNADKPVLALAASGNVVYAGGMFDTVGTTRRGRLAAVEVATGKATAWNPDAVSGLTNSYLSGLALEGDTLYAIGLFIYMSGVYTPLLAVFPPVGSPVVDRQPVGTQIGVGRPVTLEAQVSGAEPLSLQWWRDDVALPGETNRDLFIPAAQVQDTGNYTLVATNALGQVSSAPARLVVVQPVSITVQPSSQTLLPGSDLTLMVGAQGNPPPLFQWRRNGVNIPGAVSPGLIITNAQPVQSGLYNVVVQNIAGVVSSQVAEVLVSTVPLILADQLQDRSLIGSASGLGSGSTRTASRQAGEPSHAGKPGGKSVWLAWQALTNGVARFSTRGSSFDTLLAVYTNAAVAGSVEMSDLREVAGDDDRGGFHTSEVVFNAVAGTEYMIAIDGFGRASGNIVLSWNLDPNIAEVPRVFQQPVSQTVAPGADVTFSVFAASALPLFYQWVLNCELIPDATNAVLTVTNVQPLNVGSYAVLVSNSPDLLQGSPVGQCPACLTRLRAFLEIGPDSKLLTQDKLGDVTAALTRPSGQGAQLHGQSVIGSVFPGILGTQILNNFGATTEQGEPNHAGVIGGASRWQALTPEADGLLQVDTFGSKVDTVLAVYTGTDLLDLQLVAEDNNSGPDGFTSVVRFPAKRGTNYLVAADAVNAAQGEIHLNWGLGSPPAISQAPTNRVVRLGETVALLAEATGTPAPSLQWRWNGASLVGRTNATLTLTNFQAAQAGTYSVLASNFLGALTNEVATLTLADALRLHSASVLTNGTFRLLLSGDLSGKTVVQASSNLLNWLPVFTNLTPTAPIEVIDAGASNHPSRFYRAVQ